MRPSLILIAMLALSDLASGQNFSQFVPNGSFERWHSVNNYIDPDFWITNNAPGDVRVFKDSLTVTDSAYSIRINANGMIRTPQYDPPFHWWFIPYQVTIAGTDTVRFSIMRFINGAPVDTIREIVTTTQTSTPWPDAFLAPLASQPFVSDEVIVQIEGGRNAGTVLFIDRLGNYSEGISDLINGQKVSVIPNPALTQAELRFVNTGNQPFRMLLMDNTGKTVLRRDNLTTNSFTILREDLPSGIYFWELRNTKSGERAGGKIQFQ